MPREFGAERETVQDPKLERNLEEVRELHARWSQFHDFFNMAMKGENITPEAEMKFLELKTRIAILHDGFMQSLKHDHSVGAHVLDLLTNCIMLRRIPEMNQAESQKIEFDWNEAYILMTETITTLEEEQERLASIDPRKFRMEQMRGDAARRIKGFFTSGWFIAVVIFGGLIFATAGVQMTGIFDYTTIPAKWPKVAPLYDRFARYTRYVNKSWPYSRFTEFEPQGFTSKIFRLNQQASSQLNADLLINQAIALGFSEDQIPRVRELVNQHRRDFRAEAGDLMGNPGATCYAFYILFNTTADAQEFVSMRRQGIAKLDDAARDNVEKVNYVCRRSNFVAIFNTFTKELRIDYPKERWGFKDSEMGL